MNMKYIKKETRKTEVLIIKYNFQLVQEKIIWGKEIRTNSVENLYNIVKKW
jgi:hypothetical protein